MMTTNFLPLEQVAEVGWLYEYFNLVFKLFIYIQTDTTFLTNSKEQLVPANLLW